MELRVYHTGQTVNPASQIRITTGNVHWAVAVEVIQHRFKIWRTASTVDGSAPLWMSAETPATWIVIATEAVPRMPTTGVTSANWVSCCALANANTRFCHL